MRPTTMHRLAHRGCHNCAPKGWHQVPVLTGDYDFDATILHRRNPDMTRRMNQHLAKTSHSYGARSNSNHPYHGDE